MPDEDPIVFVIDDDASVRKALQRLLRTVGRRVETFASAAEFLARESLPAWACVVLDVRMPGVGGFELQRRLATSHPALPVVMITGHGDDEVRQRGLDAGAIAVLDKPFDDQVLLDAVATALERTAERPST